MMTYIGLTDQRLLHMRQVARTCYRLGHELFAWDEDKCRGMFALGFIHDIGYEFSMKPCEHPIIGQQILADTDFLFADEIRWHGIPTSRRTNELLVLNIADLLTDSTGNVVTLGERLEDIAKRYGKQSQQYLDAREVAVEITNQLKKMDFVSEFLNEHWNYDIL